MANRLFANEGFWDRVEEAVKDSGKSKSQLAREMGVGRKALCASPSAKGTDRSWHSGRVSAFCKATGVSADWLLGLSDQKCLKPNANISFKVIDTKTGKEPIFDHNHLFKEKWFKQSNLIWCDIEGFMISEDGCLMLADECGNCVYVPDRYKAVLL